MAITCTTCVCVCVCVTVKNATFQYHAIHVYASLLLTSLLLSPCSILLHLHTCRSHIYIHIAPSVFIHIASIFMHTSHKYRYYLHTYRSSCRLALYISAHLPSENVHLGCKMDGVRRRGRNMQVSELRCPLWRQEQVDSISVCVCVCVCVFVWVHSM